MKESPHWKGSLSETLAEKRKNRPVAVSEVITEWLETRKDIIEKLPDNPEPKREPTPEERINAAKRAFHQNATQAVQRFGISEYVYTDEIKHILNRMIPHLLGLPSAIPPMKGVLLVGGVGCGKSLIMQSLLKAIPAEKSFRFVEAVGLCRDAESEKDVQPFYNQYGKRIRNGEGYPNHLCIDDLYKEERERAYSYGRNPVRQILNDRYNLLRHSVRTMGTANNLLEEMDAYGPALIDRLKQMFYVIEMEGESWRG